MSDAIRTALEAARTEIRAVSTRNKDALLAQIDAALAERPVEMSPEFTDTARAALLWVLYHHQGGSSPVGQPIRAALGMGQHERLSERQLREAKRWGEPAALAQPDADGWIEWHGGECPVPGGTDVEVELGSGEREESAAAHWYWEHDNHEYEHIVRYRVVRSAS